MNKKIIIFILILVIGAFAFFKLSGSNNKQIEMAFDIYCATFQARYESELGKPLDILHPRILIANDSNAGEVQRFGQSFVTKIMPLMRKYNLDNRQIMEESKKADDFMKNEFFRKKVFDLLREKKECHPEYLD